MTSENKLNDGNGATVVAVSTNKGGVGKTTISAHVAAALANNGEDVAIIDGDPQGNLSMQFTISDESLDDLLDREVIEEYQPGDSVESYKAPMEPEDIIVTGKPSIYEATYGVSFHDNLSIRMATSNQDEYENYAKRLGFEPRSISESIVVESECGVDVVPANYQMKNLGTELSGQRDGPFRLRNVVRELSSDGYEYIIIDAPATTGVLKDNVHIAATNVIIPMQAEKSSVEATKQQVEELSQLREENTYDLDMTVIGIVLNEVRYDGEAEKVAHVIRKLIPPHTDAIPDGMSRTDFNVESIGNDFWEFGASENVMGESDVIPEGLEYFWPTIGVSPIISGGIDYTAAIAPFDIRTRVAIRRASTSNRTLYTHNEDCDQISKFDALAELVTNLRERQATIDDDEDIGPVLPGAQWLSKISPETVEYPVRNEVDEEYGHDPRFMPFMYPDESPYKQ